MHRSINKTAQEHDQKKSRGKRTRKMPTKDETATLRGTLQEMLSLKLNTRGGKEGKEEEEEEEEEENRTVQYQEPAVDSLQELSVFALKKMSLHPSQPVIT
ncbi:hypothetical protein ASPZODRAFT_2094681 [Penicilliopsis zonata CBS 506.65]|uniref:Uncharacterized protein n=1 Tax=Penicilliopsis zonata CBS 506.65 TaxID=1073090 RepID=A0A1L9SGR9_9EURO|nr:hypothetical protein ASPZODRAFT_2094681 [Penicilliopsis zonata CBS 506.65]OJJ46287.1 hypothetical protein ASPZODRAFT_2094681 [Penicilliopsis zonata CBS 506.65]